MSLEDDASPLVSELAGDPACQERLERFVVGLGERVDRLQDLESVRDWKLLEAEARSLGHEATLHGYPVLAQACQRIERVCGETVRARQGGEAVRESVIGVTEVARRVRLGHRTAAFL